MNKHFLKRNYTSIGHHPIIHDPSPTKLKSIQEELEITKILDQSLSNQTLNKSICRPVTASDATKMMDRTMAGTATVGNGLFSSPTAVERGGGEIEIIDMEDMENDSDENN